MKLRPAALACTGAIVLGGYVMGGTELLNLLWPPYGEHFLMTMNSVYPGYHATRTIGDMLVGVCYGATDGAVGGLLVAWVYNYFAKE